MLLFRNVAIVEGVEVDNEQDIFVTSFVDIHLLYPACLKIILNSKNSNVSRNNK